MYFITRVLSLAVASKRSTPETIAATTRRPLKLSSKHPLFQSPIGLHSFSFYCCTIKLNFMFVKTARLGASSCAPQPTYVQPPSLYTTPHETCRALTLKSKGEVNISPHHVTSPPSLLPPRPLPQWLQQALWMEILHRPTCTETHQKQLLTQFHFMFMAAVKLLVATFFLSFLSISFLLFFRLNRRHHHHHNRHFKSRQFVIKIPKHTEKVSFA